VNRLHLPTLVLDDQNINSVSYVGGVAVVGTNLVDGDKCVLVGRTICAPPVEQQMTLQVIIDASFSMGAEVNAGFGMKSTAWQTCLQALRTLEANTEAWKKLADVDLFIAGTRLEHVRCGKDDLIRELSRLSPPHGTANIQLALDTATYVAEHTSIPAGRKVFQLVMTDGGCELAVDTQAQQAKCPKSLVRFVFCPTENKYWRNIVKLGAHNMGCWAIADNECNVLSLVFREFVAHTCGQNGEWVPLSVNAKFLCEIPKPVDDLPIVEFPPVFKVLQLKQRLHCALPATSEEAKALLADASAVEWPATHGSEGLIARELLHALRCKLVCIMKRLLLCEHKRNEAAEQRRQEEEDMTANAVLEVPPGPPPLMRRDSLYEENTDMCPRSVSCGWP
jgi:hypothetical protein